MDRCISGVCREGFHCITHPLQKIVHCTHVDTTYRSGHLLLACSSLCALTVQAMITAGPVDTEAEYLSIVSLSCTAMGIPVPHFAWTVDFGSGAVVIAESGEISITTVPTDTPNEQISTLTLMSVEPSLANYTCNVNNLLGSDSSAAILDVQGEYSTV